MVSSLSLVSTEGKTGLLKLREVCDLTGTHENTVRRATNAGRLVCLRLPSGARRFRLADVQAWLGNPSEGVVSDIEPMGTIPIAATIRVSSRQQSGKTGTEDKGSLQHQEDRVRSFIAQRFGNKAGVTWYKSVGSGMDFNRPALLRLCEDVLAGKYSGGYIVAQDFTRICRFGIKLVEHLAKLGNCSILYAMDENEVEGKGVNESITEEILSILTHYTAKASGAKSKALTQVKVAPSSLTRVFELYTDGHSVRQISIILEKEGMNVGECGKLVTRGVVARILKDNKGHLAKLLPDNSPASRNDSIARFCESRLRLAPGTKLKFQTLRAAYFTWCEANKEVPVMSQRKLSNHVFSRFQGVQDGNYAKGARVFLNLSLLKG